MLSPISLALWSLGYFLLLFLIATWGDRLSERVVRRYKPFFIGFAACIYCSAWSFYGALTQVIEKGWYFPPTYIGAIVLLVFVSPFIRKLLDESKRGKTTSIADFLSLSFGRSRPLAILVTSISIVVLVPYIALQLKAIGESFSLLSQGAYTSVQLRNTGPFDAALVATVVLSVFAIAFGTRHLDDREHHNGLLMVIAFESIVKLIAFVAVTYFVITHLFDGVEEIFFNLGRNPYAYAHLQSVQSGGGYIAAIIVGMFAVVCLPRMFHVLVVESEGSRDLGAVRWIFPSYLLILGVCMLPVAFAGFLKLNEMGVLSEYLVLALPMLSEKVDLALLAYLGGLSAGSSMVILGCVALATMVSNELVVPLLVRRGYMNLGDRGKLGGIVQNIRRIVIVLLMLLAYAYYVLFTQKTTLGAIGGLSFSLIVQFAPAMVFSVLLRPDKRAHLGDAAFYSVLAGSCVWAYTILLPTLSLSAAEPALWLQSGPMGVSWLCPTALFGFDGMSVLTHGVLWSTGLNIFTFLLLTKKPSEIIRETLSGDEHVVTLLELRILLSRFLGADQTELALNQYPELREARGFADKDDIQVVENILAGVIGSESAFHVIEHSFTGEKESETLLDKTSQIFQFGRELLQESIDNISQGISVVDSQMKLVAWNRTYFQIFEYPNGMLHVGRGVADLIRYNAEKNGLEPHEIEEYVTKRLKLMTSGSSYVSTYIHHNGKVLEIQGAPMGEGGYVTTYTDITNYQATVTALEVARSTLETRVKERTEQLQSANVQLREANKNKTHFLAAAGHDLIQPLNAAKLFATALTQKVNDPEIKQLIDNLDLSLHSADAIISELLAIAKLDSGEMRVNPNTFCIGDLINSLKKEFTIIANKKELELHTVYCSLAVNTDEKLLKRVLQNLISNAIRYTDSGTVLIGCRRVKSNIEVEVLDQGKGIPESEIDEIFKEFHRIDKNVHDGGLGLGLATVRRLCELLKIKISVSSEEGQGSIFKVTIPKAEKRHASAVEEDEPAVSRQSVLSGMRVLSIDNEPSILEGMKAVLENWGCTFEGYTEWPEILPWEPDVLLVDYHLNDGVTGIEVAEKFQGAYGEDAQVVVISADQDNNVRAQAKSRAYFFLRKPLKTAALWSVLARIKDMKGLESTQVGKPPRK
ncbi:MAG: PAS-domain containing protein [Agarilytica sp.]